MKSYLKGEAAKGAVKLGLNNNTFVEIEPRHENISAYGRVCDDCGSSSLISIKISENKDDLMCICEKCHKSYNAWETLNYMFDDFDDVVGDKNIESRMIYFHHLWGFGAHFFEKGHKYGNTARKPFIYSVF